MQTEPWEHRSGNRRVLMATGIAEYTGVAESGQTDKYKYFLDGTLTITKPIGG